MAFPPPAQSSSASLPLPRPEAYAGEPREYARALMQRKEDIEAEIDVLKDVLSSHGATSNSPLVDTEGFPRGDIDIYSIRHARAALVRLQNDRQTVTDRLSTALQAAFAPDASSSAASSNQIQMTNGSKPPARSPNMSASNSQMRSTEIVEGWPESPMAKVNSVAPGSPAAEAGLRAGDMIHSFAGVEASEAGFLAAIGRKVAEAESVPLTLLVERGDERVRLSLTPRTGWGGRGSLGCHILPA